MVFGEITTKAQVNYEKLVRETLRDIGYDAEEKGIDYKTCEILIKIEQQSTEIAKGVSAGKSDEDIGAGDQVIIFCCAAFAFFNISD